MCNTLKQNNCEAFSDRVHVKPDDMIITAADEKEHAEIVQEVKQRAKWMNKVQPRQNSNKVIKVKYMINHKHCEHASARRYFGEGSSSS